LVESLDVANGDNTVLAGAHKCCQIDADSAR